MERNSVVKIAGTEYEIDPNSYSEWVEADIVGARRFNEIIGSSRPGDEPRPEIRTWKIDDWSKGEGYKFLVSEPGHPSLRGFFSSSGGVTMSRPGQVELGLISNVQSNTNPTGAAYLVAADNLWAAFDSSTNELTTVGTDTWTVRTSGMGAQTIVGPITDHMAGIFIAGARSGADGGVRRVTAAGQTSWVAESARAPLVADNRVYYHTVGTTTSALKRTGLDAAAAGTTMTTFNGVGTTYTGAPIQSVAIGARIYTLIRANDESLRLWVLENNVGREVCVFTRLFVAADKQPMAVVNGIIFVGGYEEIGTTKHANQGARLDYFDGIKWGSITNRNWVDSLEVGVSQFTALAPGGRNELLLSLATTNIAGTGFAMTTCVYDLNEGALYQVGGINSVAGLAASSLAMHRNQIYVAEVAGTIYRTTSSGSNRYLVTSTITEPIWDFDLPDTEKLLTEIEVHTETLDTGTSVEVQIVLDGTTTVTTDSSGATMAHTSGTRTKFTLSDFDTERTFRFIQPKIVLKTSNTANTPILYSVTLRCLPLATKLRYFEFDVLCRDETATNRLTNRQRTGDDIAADLMALRDSTTDRVFQFVPLIKDAVGPHPGPTETTFDVMLAPGEQNGVYRSVAPGEGKMKFRLFKVA